MNILKRELAPITENAWRQIHQEADRSLRSNLTARKLVDVAGPLGFDFSAVAAGRLDTPETRTKDSVGYGIRKVLPLVELRASFEIDLWELDNAERGAKDLDLSSLTLAAKRIAGFEETAIYKGFEPAQIAGMAQTAGKGNEPIPISRDFSKYQDAIIQARMRLEDREVEGPYGLVLGAEPYRILYGTGTVYPMWKQVEQLLGDKVLFSPFIEGGFLVSRRGGDMELVLGQDFSIGFESSDPKKVRLYLTESFTFRILHPKAVAPLSFAP